MSARAAVTERMTEDEALAALALALQQYGRERWPEDHRDEQ